MSRKAVDSRAHLLACCFQRFRSTLIVLCVPTKTIQNHTVDPNFIGLCYSLLSRHTKIAISKIKDHTNQFFPLRIHQEKPKLVRVRVEY